MRISLTSSGIDILSTVWKALHIIAMTIFLRSVLRAALLLDMKSPVTGRFSMSYRSYYRQDGRFSMSYRDMQCHQDFTIGRNAITEFEKTVQYYL